jgi:protein-S-isoprenylcysteine O-methyltransferase Ste14
VTEEDTSAAGDCGADDPEPEPGDWSAARRRAFARALGERRARHVRASQRVALLLMAAVAAAVLLRVPQAWWMPAVGVIALFGVALRFWQWRCPNCGERLPSRRAASVCLGCGAPLD